MIIPMALSQLAALAQYIGDHSTRTRRAVSLEQIDVRGARPERSNGSGTNNAVTIEHHGHLRSLRAKSSMYDGLTAVRLYNSDRQVEDDLADGLADVVWTNPNGYRLTDYAFVTINRDGDIADTVDGNHHLGDSDIAVHLPFRKFICGAPRKPATKKFLGR